MPWARARLPGLESKLAELVRGLKDARKRLCIDVHRSRVSASTRTVFPEVERDVAQMIASTYGCNAPADRQVAEFVERDSQVTVLTPKSKRRI